MWSWVVANWTLVLGWAIAAISVIVNAWVVRNQLSLQLASLKSRIDDSVIHWGERAIRGVADAEFLAARMADGEANLDERMRAHGDALSALADAGRLFFPNEAPESQGADRAGAFQGVRPPILDAIVFSCILMAELRKLPADQRAPRATQAIAFLNDCRRLVVTELQNAIDPRQKERLLSQMRRGRLDDERSPYALAKDLGIWFNESYPDHPTMRSWTATHIHGINKPSKEPPPDDLSTRFYRLVWSVGDYLVRTSSSALRNAARDAKR